MGTLHWWVLILIFRMPRNLLQKFVGDLWVHKGYKIKKIKNKK